LVLPEDDAYDVRVINTSFGSSDFKKRVIAARNNNEACEFSRAQLMAEDCH
jgi:hypothetical protein